MISDTHGLLRDEVVEILKGCDLIIHAGDIGKDEVIEGLQDIGKVEFVKGNCDKDIKNYSIPYERIIKLDKRIDIIISGHSHKMNIYEENGIIYINPGSVGPKRFKLPINMAKLYIDEDVNKNNLSENIFKRDKYMVEIIEI